MKILQILPKFDQGGVESGTLLLSRKLLDSGFESHVAAEDGRLVSKHVELGGHYLKMNMATKNPIKIILNGFRLARYIERNAIDLVHARSRAPAYSAFIACQKTKVPFVTTFHAAYNFKGRFKRFYNSIMARGDRVVAISQFIDNHIKQNYQGVLKDPEIALIPNGIDLEFCDPQKVKRDQKNVFKDLGLSNPERVILMPGRLTRIKGHLTALEAFAKIAHKIDHHVVILGSAQGRVNYVEELEQKVQALGLRGRVHFIEHTDDLPSYLKACDFVVHAATVPEAFGRVIAESMAMEKVTIASNLGAPREFVQDGVTGFLHEAGNATNLARVLEKVIALEDPAKKEIGVRARAHIKEHYELDQMLSKQIKLYQEMLKKN